MSTSVINTIEYLVLIVSEFAHRSKLSDSAAYNYLEKYGALAWKKNSSKHTLAATTVDSDR